MHTGLIVISNILINAPVAHLSPKLQVGEDALLLDFGSCDRNHGVLTHHVIFND